jgi:xylan 1,4-beta-xylosidase
MNKKLTLLFFMVFSGLTVSSQNRQISLDINQVKGNHSKVFKECIGAGRANEGLRADWQQQLKLVQDEIGFKYIRFHGLLSDDMGVYREDSKGNPEYNYQYIDVLFDYLLSVKLKPFVELGFMPSALASGPQTIFWWRGNVTPPKSYEKWGEFMRNLVLHFEQRYGQEEVKSWYFEVWNEPDLKAFFSGSLDEYLKLYDVTVKEIKSVCKDYKVGGPASASPFLYETEFLKHCVNNNIPVDFISTHAYGVREGFLDEFGQKGTLLDQDKNAITSRMLRSRELIKESKLPGLELHFTEWSTSYTPFDPVHDSYHSAAFILDKVKGAENAVNSMSYWVFTDIFEEPGPRWTPFHGGFGLLNYQTIKKPAYFAYYFMNQLGNTELVNSDKASWACKDKNGDIQLLYWNYTPTMASDSVNNQVYYKRDLPSKSAGDVEISLSNLPKGNYNMEIYQIGYQVNDVYASYIKMGSPSQITREQVSELKQKNNGNAISSETIKIKNGKLEKKMGMRENDVFLVKVRKI